MPDFSFLQTGKICIQILKKRPTSHKRKGSQWQQRRIAYHKLLTKTSSCTFPHSETSFGSTTYFSTNTLDTLNRIFHPVRMARPGQNKLLRSQLSTLQPSRVELIWKILLYNLIHRLKKILPQISMQNNFTIFGEAAK